MVEIFAITAHQHFNEPIDDSLDYFFSNVLFYSQATATAFLFLSSALQGVLLMQAENMLGTPLDQEAMAIQTCVAEGDLGHQQPKDYSSYLNFVTIYMSVLILIFIGFFNTEMKRTNADKEAKRESEDAEAAAVTQGLVETGATNAEEDQGSERSNGANSSSASSSVAGGSFQGVQRGM